jgi:hypothetical protein
MNMPSSKLDLEKGKTSLWRFMDPAILIRQILVQTSSQEKILPFHILRDTRDNIQSELQPASLNNP